MLAEKSRELGGRVLREAVLPGLSTWIRVRDYRVQMLAKLAAVSVYRESAMSADDVSVSDCDHVVLATGSSWRRDGLGTLGEMPVPVASDAPVFTPDDSVIGKSVIVYDDDHYAVGSAFAEKLKREGRDVLYVTPAPIVSSWTQMTDEQSFIQARLMQLRIDLLLSHVLIRISRKAAHFACIHTGRERVLALGAIVLVTGRIPNDSLYHELIAARFDRPVTRIGDCVAPSHIADAVYSGHRFAREFGEPPSPLLRRERPDP
jgi:dimethylamine/trimethylamine dehydrogenase